MEEWEDGRMEGWKDGPTDHLGPLQGEKWDGTEAVPPMKKRTSAKMPKALQRMDRTQTR
jgi:hypothetical protein